MLTHKEQFNYAESIVRYLAKSIDEQYGLSKSEQEAIDWIIDEAKKNANREKKRLEQEKKLVKINETLSEIQTFLHAAYVTDDELVVDRNIHKSLELIETIYEEEEE